MEENIINAYITDSSVLEEKRKMKKEMEKNINEEYKQGLITKDERNEKLIMIESEFDGPSKEVVDKQGNIITGYKKTVENIPYDGEFVEDYTEEFSSNIYKDVFRRKTESERAFLNLLENDIQLYTDTNDEDILNKYSEKISESVKNLIAIGADYTEIHEYLIENGISIKEEAPSIRR